MIFITISFVFTNLAQGTKAGELNGGNKKPIIAHIVSSEFGEIEQDIYFESALSAEELSLGLTQSYLGEEGSLSNNLKIDQEVVDEDKFAISPLLDQTEENILNSPQVAIKTQAVKRKDAVSYVVESGDTISTIAQKFGISVNTILWENDLNSHGLIRPGDELSILPETGLTHKVKSGDTLGAIASLNDIEIEDILESNNMTLSSKLSIGQKLLIPGGSKIVSVASVKKATQSYTGIQAIKNIVKPAPQKTVANKMAWPTVGNRITQYYSWRHKGLDIANKTGTPLFAADTGNIKFVGWSNGYGNNIIVDHGGGKKTRYAHMSKFYVSKGDDVTKGEAIGEMGSTGWSTGPHIHFEITIDGVKYNPLNYIR
ncbi:MAG: M23 family metallopeptidase [Patescibacteria group bacterium]|nr:M23 family metallopeptidase [Patescibacteria group bacterium]